MNGDARNGTPGESYEFRPGEEYQDRYEKVRELGRGRFGIVYEVTDGGGRRYAAKHIKARKRDIRVRTIAEVNLLYKLRHPHILSLIAAFQSPTHLIILTELLSGGELFEKVAADNFELTEAEVVVFMRDITEGAKYIHQQEIAHLDLKPENVVCCEADSSRVKIIDFGLARKIAPGTSIKVMSGTPEFVAPEVVNYDPVSVVSDMWSLGVIAYVLLSGLSPFQGDTVPETYSNVSRAEYDFDEPEFDEITETAKDFISSLLVKDAKNRLTSERAIEHEWLRPGSDSSEEQQTRSIDKTNLKKYLARRRWQRCGQAIRAMQRMSVLSARRQSTQSTASSSEGGSLDIPSTPSSAAAASEAAVLKFPIIATSENAEEDDDSSSSSGCEADFSYEKTYRSSVTIQIEDHPL